MSGVLCWIAMARIKIKNSQVKDKAPVPSDLVAGELAINTHADSPAIYLKDTANAVRKIAGAGAVAAAASETTQGIVELATAAETTTGTDNTRAVHPAGLKVELDKKANLASPALTGTPTAPTAAAGTNTTQIATTAFVTDAVAKENLWDRTGTVVSPANAGDDIDLGTGDISVADALVKGVAVLGGTTAAPRATIAGSQDGTGSGGKVVFSTTADGASSPTERMRLTSTGQLRLAGAGITFNGDTATANELDDYEEGTCLASTGNWTNVGSDYVKIGRFVYINIRGNVATASQAISLPFTIGTTGDAAYGAFSVHDATTMTGIVGGANCTTTTITLPVGFIKGHMSYMTA